MKAIVYEKYGPPEVLQFKDVGKPVPADNEVLVKVYATTVNRTDCATIRAKPFFARIFTGILKPNKLLELNLLGKLKLLGRRWSLLKWEIEFLDLMAQVQALMPNT